LKGDAIQSASLWCLPLLAALGACEGRHPPQPSTQPGVIAGTYAKDCPTAPSAWRRSGKLADSIMTNVIRVDTAGNASWNGSPATIEILRGYLREVDAAPASKLIFIAKGDAQCGDVQAIRRIMSKSATCRGQGECAEGEKNLPAPVF